MATQLAKADKLESEALMIATDTPDWAVAAVDLVCGAMTGGMK